MSTESVIEEKQLAPILVGAIRMQGKYSDCGAGFKQLGRKLGFNIAGKAMMLCHDAEYKSDGADFEVCMPIRQQVEKDGVDVRELPAVRCLSMVHVGPYDTLSKSYEVLRAEVEKRGLKLKLPSREVYLKGPGMILKGNPKKYRTELQLVVEDE